MHAAAFQGLSQLTDRVTDLADRLIRWAGLCPPIDVEEAARRLGIDIETVTLSKGLDGLLLQEEPGRWLIVLNRRIRHPGRIRYTIAHELGHWAMHRRLITHSSRELFNWRRAEWEANRFASHLLIPRPHLVGTYAKVRELRQPLHDLYGVSTEAIVMAIKECRLIPGQVVGS